MKKRCWGIISTGRIASIFAGQLSGSKSGTLSAVASRSEEKAGEFAGKYGADRWYGSYEDLLRDPGVEVVYIATPHPMHAKWAIRAARAGKHILCEKPLTMNAGEAENVIGEARKNGVFLMEAFHYRCHPQTKKLIEILKEGMIGEVLMIQASFSFRMEYDLSHRALNRSLGGGGILDVGCYPMSLVRLVAGVAKGGDFIEPVDVKGCAFIGKESRVDEYAAACLEFPGGIIAQISCGCRLEQENTAVIYGSEGKILIPKPWVVSIEGGTSTIIVERYDQDNPREIMVEAERGLFAIEADTAGEFIPQRQSSFPAMSWEDSLGNMRALDLWRRSIGLSYDMD